MIKIDINSGERELNRIWSMGFNTCHAPLLLREDMRAHLNMGAEIGFKYIRFHDIFCDEVGIYNIDVSGEPEYNFEKFDRIFDTILSCGLLPFFELSFCPKALKSSDAVLCHYEANTSMPKSLGQWKELVHTVTAHCVNRYGLECVKGWYFEVWNEPDLPFFEPRSTTEYFKLYDAAVEEIKSVSKELRVGGPATSKCAWIDEFISHVCAKSNPEDYCDFISTHAYPSDLPFLNSAGGNVKLQNSKIMKELFTNVREKMDTAGLNEIPLFMGEWNSSAGPYAFNHDEMNNGAFIVKTLAELEPIVDGMLYWNLSDIYEEGGFHYAPFHGGFGIINVNSIPKSSYNAFRLLNRLNGKKLMYDAKDIPKNCGLLTSFDNKKLYILLYNYTEPDSEGEWWECRISINIPFKTLRYESLAVNSNGGSPYEWWKQINEPEFITLPELALLQDKSNMQRTDRLIINKNGEAFLSESIEPGEIKLIELSVCGGSQL